MDTRKDRQFELLVLRSSFLQRLCVPWTEINNGAPISSAQFNAQGVQLRC